MSKVRLQKFIAQSGIASRRAAEKLIANGEIKINGKTETSLGTKIDPETDTVTYKAKKLSVETTKNYIAFHKPKNCITTSKDKFAERTIYDILSEKYHNLKPAGRLDKDTTGLLVLSNDGDFIYKLTHPKFELEKEYIVTCKKIITPKAIKLLQSGIVIEDKKTSPAQITNLSTTTRKSTMHIIIHEGRKRQIRRMFEAVGHPVLELQRVRIGTIELDNLKDSQTRPLTENEILSITKT